MFANLKNKLIEEVKASPSKFQQFANAAQAAVSSSSSTPSGSSESTTVTTNENFFSITEEDTPQNSPYKPLKLPPGIVRGRSTTPQGLLNNGTGAIPRTRKLSNSSVASDVSFRLPAYDAPAVYHLQSDLDETASEIDDSTSTAKLDSITKEQLYDAYKKSLDRYHKYRCRYSDLAKKYKDLERDSTKARSVLVETQEKAIRRINELREQCALEQQAKAHLEEALRMEMDDMQCKMQAYQTKLHLLGESPENIAAALDSKLPAASSTNESLIDFSQSGQEVNTSIDLKNVTNLAGTAQGLGDASTKISQLEKELQDREHQLSALTEKMAKSTATIEQLRKQEEENALLLAQTKQAIHSELESKENEVKNLKDNLKQAQSELQTLTRKESELSGQLEELKELKEKLKQIQAAKQESDAKVIAADHMLSELRDQSAVKEKAFLIVEEKLAELTKESEHKLQDLRQQNSQLSEMVQRYQQNEVSLAEIDNELNRTKNENDDLIAALAENEQKVQALLKLSEQKEYDRQERSIKEEERLRAEQARIDELVKQLEDERALRDAQEQKMMQLEAEMRILSEQNANNESETISALKAEMHKAHVELNAHLSSTKEQLASKEKELKAATNKLTKQKKQHDTQQHKITEQNEELEKLRNELNRHEQHLLTLQNEARERDEQTEHEKNELKTQVTNILHEISQMEEQMRVVQQSHTELEAEKRNLEAKMGSMQQQAQDAEKGTQRWHAETEKKVRTLETKLINVESENVQLAEKNCLLEESSQRLEKLLTERERQEVAEAARVSDMRLKLETAEDAIQKLNEKMSQVLDENSRMQNAQELMDHDYRTLQDKYDAVEKEKLLAQDAEKCLVAEVAQLKENKTTQDLKLRELVNEHLQAEEKLAEEHKTRENIIKSNRDELEAKVNAVTMQLNELRAMQSDDDKLRDLLQQKQTRVEELQRALEEKAQIEQETSKDSGREIAAMRAQINQLEQATEHLEHAREELELLRGQRETLTEKLGALSEELNARTQACLELEIKLKEVDSLREAYEVNKEQLAAVKREEEGSSAVLEKYKSLLNEQQQATSKLQNQLESYSTIGEELEHAQEELSTLKKIEQRLTVELQASKEKSALQIQKLESQLNTANGDVEKLHESNDAFQLEIDQLKGKHELQVQALEQTLKQVQEEQSKLQTQLKIMADNEEKLRNFEQMQLENEYLNNHAKQLQCELEARKEEVLSKLNDNDELREKLKSIQCELYVLKENAQKHDGQLEAKQQELSEACDALEELKANLTNERVELARQTEHAKFVTEQNDGIQQELLHVQNQLAEVEQQLSHTHTELGHQKESSAHAATAYEQREESLRAESERNRITIETLNKEVSEITAELQEKERLQDELNAMRVELEERNTARIAPAQALENDVKPGSVRDAEHLRHINDTLQHELEELKGKSSAQIDSLQQEIEDLRNNNKHMMERMTELESIRAGMQAQRLLVPATHAHNIAKQASSGEEEAHNEKEELENKLKAIMAEVQDVSNRNIFLEQKCENFLILEQSNERLKLQNSKLSRQLDETLVSMQHNESITANTEFEYLKNIMFQYLTGSANGNNETLVKVISAVLKFSPQQTQVALEKEHQRRSLINKIL